MHVVHVYDGHERVHGGRGSVPGVVWNLARETAAAGHEVTVVERQWAGLPSRAEHDGVAFRRLALWTGADEPWTRIPYEVVESPVGLARLIADRTYFAARALRELRALAFDAVHVHLPFAASVQATVAPWLRDWTVYTAHLGELRLDALADGGDAEPGDEGDGSGDSGRSAGTADGGEIERSAETDDTDPSAPWVLSRASPDVFLAKRVARTTVLNRAIREAFVGRGVPSSKLAVVPNGVDVERFAAVDDGRIEAMRANYDIHGAVLLFVGTVVPRKGVADLVAAVERVADGRPVTLVIAGETDLDDAYVERIRERIDGAGLADQVRMPGFVPAEDLPALYRLADLFVLPSLEEGFGMTAVEAMAAGTPVVATRVGALPAVLGDGAGGVLVEPGDPPALAAAIERLLDDPAERERLGERARERAADYRWSNVAEEFLGIYQEVGP